MSRCEHRFNLEGCPCPKGCHDAKLLEVLKKHETLHAAADSLGWPRVGDFYQRARLNPAIAAEVRRLKPARVHKNGAHPAFVDMTDEVKGPWTVLKRLPNTSNGNAAWLCQHTCGATQAIQGIALRSSTPTCKACKGGNHAG